MVKIMYIPLDERPCTYFYAQKIVEDNASVEMIVPPVSMLGQKKSPADIEHLWAWVKEKITDCNYLIASIDMLIYGGIVPSRLHYKDIEQCEQLISGLVGLKRINPSLNIFAFNLIMRVPAYSSSDEEPDYYGIYGEKIFRYSWLTDKLERGKKSIGDVEQLDNLKNKIPEEALHDFTQRRKVNSYVNYRIAELTKDGLIDFLVLPLDDCAEYGFSANEQYKLLKYVEEHNVQDRIYLYPGADEVGCSLTARVLNIINNRIPRVFIRYSSTVGPDIIPVCEDRPLGESIKSQIIAAGGIPVDNSIESDIVLMVNSPTQSGESMGDARIAKDPSCYSMRNVREFTSAIQYYIAQKKRVAVADVAFCNGSDSELMRMLSKQAILTELYSYAGWNTSGNTLGTVISHAFSRLYTEENCGTRFVAERLVEDWGYQALVRQVLLKQMQAEQLSMESDLEKVKEMGKQELNKFLHDYIPEYKEKYLVEDVYFPWKRLFEVGFSLKEK